MKSDSLKALQNVRGGKDEYQTASGLEPYACYSMDVGIIDTGSARQNLLLCIYV